MHVLRRGATTLEQLNRAAAGDAASPAGGRTHAACSNSRSLAHTFHNPPARGARIVCATPGSRGASQLPGPRRPAPTRWWPPSCARRRGWSTALALLFAETEHQRCGRRLLADRLVRGVADPARCAGGAGPRCRIAVCRRSLDHRVGRPAGWRQRVVALMSSRARTGPWKRMAAGRRNRAAPSVAVSQTAGGPDACRLPAGLAPGARAGRPARGPAGPNSWRRALAANQPSALFAPVPPARGLLGTRLAGQEAWARPNAHPAAGSTRHCTKGHHLGQGLQRVHGQIHGVLR